MKEFDELLEVADTLLSPKGCPWDNEQTFFSLQPYVLEEAHEVVEAVDNQDDKEIMSELGDLLYTVVFYAKIAQKEGRFTIADVLTSVKEKLVRRHPHVFEKRKVSVKQVVEKWEQIKKTEKGETSKESALDSVPKNLHALARAQKILTKIGRIKPELLEQSRKREHPLSEPIIGEEMIGAITDAIEAGIDVEGALRRALQSIEKRFRTWEEQEK